MNNTTLVLYLFMFILSYTNDDLSMDETGIEPATQVIQVIADLDSSRKRMYTWC